MAAKSALVLLLYGVFAAASDGAQPTEQVLPQARDLSFTQLDRAEALARYGHPNEMWRYRALRALKLEQPGRALENFRDAARYGDKFSQHALSLMHWHGVGTAVDRAQAYIWADLAAERGYRDLLLVREKMWLEMDATLRARVLLLGGEMYAQYGDSVAKPRIERAMRRALANATGSRVGATTDRIVFGGGEVSARDFYVTERWKADTYWREQDRQWNAKVIVLPPEPIRDSGSNDN